MNQKKAKALRRMARNSTVGAPAVDYQPMKPIIVFEKHDILQRGRNALWLGQAVLASGCTRAEYHALKNQVKRYGAVLGRS